MKRYGLLFFSFFSMAVFGQKPPLSMDAVNHWAYVSGGQISGDGAYVCYTSAASGPGSQTLVVKATRGHWEKCFGGTSGAAFVHGLGMIIFRQGKDRLILWTLGTDSGICLSGVSSFKVAASTHGHWLAYGLETDSVVLRDLDIGKEEGFEGKNFAFNATGTALLLERRSTANEASSVGVVDLVHGGERVVWQGSAKRIGACVFGPGPDQLAFFTQEDSNGEERYVLWYYKRGMDSAVVLVSERSATMPTGFSLGAGQLSFSQEGEFVLCNLRAKEGTKRSGEGPGVDVWSYRDTLLQCLQLEGLREEATYGASVNVSTRRMVRLTDKNERISAKGKDWVLVDHQLGNYGSFEASWNPAVRPSFWLVSMRSGEKRLIEEGLTTNVGIVRMSPDGRWVVYYDVRQGNYCSVNVETGERTNMTKGVMVDWTDVHNTFPDPSLRWVAAKQAWLCGEDKVFVYDSYDIWLLDLHGKQRPVNITGGYGKRHEIRFSLLDDDRHSAGFFSRGKTTLTVRAVSDRDKRWGFYAVRPGAGDEPQRLTLDNYIYGEWLGHGMEETLPIRAEDTACYLVTRMSATEAPNYFVTTDFVHFTPLSDVEPQRAFNWMTSALIHWPMSDGKQGTGILYRPEDFSPVKRYPVLFDYYDMRSDELNMYITPELSSNRINIAWYVSNGYVVVVPDIMFSKAGPGLSAYNSIVSAAMYMKSFPWVDAARMGLQGHSFGGYETEFVITRTHLFAAACSASGFADLISWYGSAYRGSFPMYWAENSQGRFGVTPWQDQKKYLENSPILRADKVTTPLLMMQNKGDQVVPFAQGVELFTCLRRLGSPVWMLQYDGGDHSIGNRSESLDFTIRMTQFFDHYLKKGPSPVWMTRGVPAEQKGLDTGLEIDSLYEKRASIN